MTLDDFKKSHQDMTDEQFAAVSRVAEAAGALGGSMGGDLIEAASRALLMDKSHSGIRSALYTCLSQQESGYPYIDDVFGDDKAGTVVYTSASKSWQRTYKRNESGGYDLGPSSQVQRAYVGKEAAGSVVIPEGVELAESQIETEPVELVESAVAADGTIRLRLIKPGPGTSGYYPADVLKRDGPKVFTEGMQMFWDHDTDAEEAARPEGSLSRLAAVLTENAKWDDNGPKGPGLYSRAKVTMPFRSSVDELAPHIGVSIRAVGKAAHGQVAGKPMSIVRSIEAAKSVDFVTKAGAGGQICSCSKRRGAANQVRRQTQ